MSSEDNEQMMEDSPEVAAAAAAPVGEAFDEAPAFVDPDDAVEVKVDDDAPMDDDDEGENIDAEQNTEEMKEEVVDMSRFKIESHGGPVYAVNCHFDATSQRMTVVTGGGDDRAFLHHLQGAVPATHALDHAHTDSVSAVALNLDFVSEDLTKTPRLAAVGAYDGAILLYDPDTGAKVHSFEGPTDVEWAAFHPKGGSVLLVGSAADNTLWMFHIPLKKCLQVFVGHEASVTAGDFSPDGRWALSASADGTVRLWAPRTGVCKHVFRFHNVGEDPAGLTCMAIGGGSDGQLVVVGAEDGQAHVCHIGSKKVVASVRHTDMNPAPNAMQDEAEEGTAVSVEAAGFAPCNPNWFATGGVDGVLKIWDLANGAQCRQTCRLSDTSDGITRLRWHTSLPLCFTASTSGVIRLWDARNGSLLSSLTGHADVINDLNVCFADEARALICTASDDKTVRLFELDIQAALQGTQV